MKTKKTAFGLLWGESWGNAQSLRQSCSHGTSNRPLGRRIWCANSPLGCSPCGTRLVGTVPTLFARKVDAARLEATPSRSDSPARTNSPLGCSARAELAWCGSLQPWLGAWLPRPCSFCWLGWRFWVGALRMWRAGRILRGLRARTARRQRRWWPTRRAWTSRTATATRMPGTTRPLRRAFNFPAARLRWRAKAPRWKAPRSSSRKRAPTWCRASLKGRSWWKRQTT